MSLGSYVLGDLILIAGILYLARLIQVPQPYIVAIGVIMAGIGIAMGVQSTRQKDPN
jgi:hypothetical protein